MNTTTTAHRIWMQTDAEREAAAVAELEAIKEAQAAAAATQARAEEDGAIKLQGMIRGRSSRKRVAGMRQDRDERRKAREQAQRKATEHKAAVHIQHAAISWLHKCRREHLRATYAEEERKLTAMGNADSEELLKMRQR